MTNEKIVYVVEVDSFNIEDIGDQCNDFAVFDNLTEASKYFDDAVNFFKKDAKDICDEMNENVTDEYDLVKETLVDYSNTNTSLIKEYAITSLNNYFDYHDVVRLKTKKLRDTFVKSERGQYRFE